MTELPNMGECRACSAPMIWAVMYPSGKNNPLDPEPSDKLLKRQPAGAVKASWGMRDANGNSVNGNMGKKVLAQAARMGRIDA